MTRVKNILVSDVEIFQEELIQELIKNQISYVKIDNEFHFLDHIYRIYDLKKTLVLFLQHHIKLSIIDFNNCLNEYEFNITEPQIYNMMTEQYVPSLNLENNNFDFCKDNYHPRFNKRLIKKQNREVNKIINKK